MAPDDVFAWAASLPSEHTCEWVSHPTQDELRERDERIVWKRLWYCPLQSWHPCSKVGSEEIPHDRGPAPVCAGPDHGYRTRRSHSMSNGTSSRSKRVAS